MARDKHLSDSERAHNGKPGSKVRHGADAIGKAPSARYHDVKNTLEFEDSSPGLGNPDPRDYVPYKAPSDRPVRRSGTPN